MKKVFIFFFLLASLAGVAQDDALNRANQLIDAKKYESAFMFLDSIDPDNADPEIVIAKSELVLDYFASSIMHQMFALTDLEPDQDIMDVRGSEGQFNMVMFAPDSALLPLAAKYPDNDKIQKALGNFYHEVHLKYPENWLLPDSVVIQSFLDYYKTAYDHGEYDYWSAYGIGYAYLLNQHYEQAVPYFEKSVELKSDYPSAHYNLAYALVYQDKREEAIESAHRAMELYEYPVYKADAARLIAAMYSELRNNQKALEYYRIADTTDPGNYYTLKPMLTLETAINDEKYRKTTQRFFLLDPDNPTIYEDLMNIYQNTGKSGELVAFLKSQTEDHANEPKIMGSLYFYLGIIGHNTDGQENARQYFAKAREYFRQVFPPDHQVFEVIDSFTSD